MKSKTEKTIAVEEAYKAARRKIVEDAVMGAGDAAPAGDISSPPSGPAPDTDIVKPSGATSHDDVLGHYEPGKGFMGKKDFYIPKNVLGKGNILHRKWNELPGTKKCKGHPNDSAYLKGMKTISDDEASDFENSEDFKKNKFLAMDRVTEEEVIDYVLKNFNIDAENYLDTAQIVLVPGTDLVWIKFKCRVPEADYPVFRFAEANFDAKAKKFTPTANKKLMTIQQVKKIFIKACKDNGQNLSHSWVYVVRGIKDKQFSKDFI